MIAVLATYRMLLRQQITNGRLVLIGGFSSLAIAVSIAFRNVDDASRTTDGIEFMAVFGIALMVPIVSLVLGSSTFGELIDDETLVYLWHRPVARWKLALAGAMSASTAAVPLTAIPLMVAALIATGDINDAFATGIASALAAIAYSSLFVLVGLVLRRALIWGLVYVFIWEFFIASVGGGSAQLSIRNYPTSVLSQMTDVEIRLADSTTLTATIVSFVIAGAAVALAAWRLDKMDVA